MTAGKFVCALCPKPAVHLHHLSGRDPNHLRLDPDLKIPLCFNHHVLVHNLLRGQGIDVPGRAPWIGPADAMAFRLKRLAVMFGLYADRHDDPIWPLLAVHHREWGDLLSIQSITKETQQ